VTENFALLAAGAADLGISLDSWQAATFEAYADLLLTWNQRFNLLGPSAVSALWSRHLLDALTITLALPERTVGAGFACLDVGSGAGIPGIPLAIAFPEWDLTLLEVTTKKARFLEMAIDTLGLANARVVRGRAEDVAHDPDHRAAYDLCVARAVARTAALLELTLPFVSRQGDVILYKGVMSLSDELEEAESARALLGGSPPSISLVTLAGSEGRCLVRYRKVAGTPKTLPRRPGIPEHHALVAPEVAPPSGPARGARGRQEPRRQ